MSKEPSKASSDGIYANIPDPITLPTISNSSNNNNNNDHDDDDFESSEMQNCKLNNNDKCATMNNLMNHKDALYATPLRKSDRHKSRKSPSSDNEKISNIKHMNGNDDAELKNLMDRTYLNSELGENRIKDFLKDTAHMHKKIEPPGKEHIGSSFSYLARKEHFVNLVHQNILKDQPACEDNSTSNENEIEQDKDLINLEDSFEPSGDLEETEKLINKLVDFQNKIALQSQSAVASPSIISVRLAPNNIR
jgi:hypothetical protein